MIKPSPPRPPFAPVPFLVRSHASLCESIAPRAFDSCSFSAAAAAAATAAAAVLLLRLLLLLRLHIGLLILVFRDISSFTGSVEVAKDITR